jgi:putative flippase GtrA
MDSTLGPATVHRSTAAPLPGAVTRVARGLGRDVLVFAAIGVASTAAYAVLYLPLRPLAGAVTANALALLLTAVANTAANRRFTFRVRDPGRAAVVRDQLAGLAALGVALAITTGAVSLLAVLVPAAGHLVELAVLVAAYLAATVARFVLLRAVIARPTPVPVAVHLAATHRSPS